MRPLKKEVSQAQIVEIDNYEVYSDQEFKEMLKEDKLPSNLAKKAASLWPDFK